MKLTDSILIIWAFFAVCFIHRSYACVGGGQVGISFQQDPQGGNLIVSLKTGGRTTEVEDDTGYVSMDMAIVHLVKSARDPSANGEVDPGKFTSVIDFLKSRASVFRKSITEAGGFSPSAKIQILVAIDNITKVAAANPLKGSDLAAAEDQLNHSLFEAKMNVTAATRNSGETDWNTEKPISALDLPTSGLSRSNAGCNSTTTFSPNIGAGGKTALPAFNLNK